MNKKFLDVILAMVEGIAGVFILSLILMCISNTCFVFYFEDNYVIRDNPILHFVVWAVLFLALFGIYRLVKIKNITLNRSYNVRIFKKLSLNFNTKDVCVGVICLIVFAVGLWYILETGYYPNADQKKIMRAAADILKGDMSTFALKEYNGMYHHQIGMTLISAFLQLIVGAKNYVGLQIINLFFYLLCIAGVYIFVKENFKRCELATTFVFAFFIPFAMYVPFLYGTMMGMAFSLWCFIMAARVIREEKAMVSAALSVLFAFLALVSKSNYMIFMAGVVCILIADIIRKVTRAKLACMVGLILVMIFTTPFMVKIAEGMYGSPMPNGVPSTAYIAMGLQDGERAPGWHNEFCKVVFMDNGYDSEIADAESKKAIAESVQGFMNDPLGASRFFYKKVATQWTNPSFQCFWNMTKCTGKRGISDTMEDLLNDKTGAAVPVRISLDYIESFILLGALLCIVLGFRKLTTTELLLLIPFIGGFLFHIVWEAKAQYTIVYFVLLIPYAVRGFVSVFELMDNMTKVNESSRKGIVKVVAVFATVILLEILLQTLPSETLDATVRSDADQSTYEWMMENAPNMDIS